MPAAVAAAVVVVLKAAAGSPRSLAAAALTVLVPDAAGAEAVAAAAAAEDEVVGRDPAVAVAAAAVVEVARVGVGLVVAVDHRLMVVRHSWECQPPVVLAEAFQSFLVGPRGSGARDWVVPGRACASHQDAVRWPLGGRCSRHRNSDDVEDRVAGVPACEAPGVRDVAAVSPRLRAAEEEERVQDVAVVDAAAVAGVDGVAAVAAAAVAAADRDGRLALWGRDLGAY